MQMPTFSARRGEAGEAGDGGRCGDSVLARRDCGDSRREDDLEQRSRTPTHSIFGLDAGRDRDADAPTVVAAAANRKERPRLPLSLSAKNSDQNRNERRSLSLPPVNDELTKATTTGRSGLSDGAAVATPLSEGTPTRAPSTASTTTTTTATTFRPSRSSAVPNAPTPTAAVVDRHGGDRTTQPHHHYHHRSIPAVLRVLCAMVAITAVIGGSAWTRHYRSIWILPWTDATTPRLHRHRQPHRDHVGGRLGERRAPPAREHLTQVSPAGAAKRGEDASSSSLSLSVRGRTGVHGVDGGRTEAKNRSSSAQGRQYWQQRARNSVASADQLADFMAQVYRREQMMMMNQKHTAAPVSRRKGQHMRPPDEAHVLVTRPAVSDGASIQSSYFLPQFDAAALTTCADDEQQGDSIAVNYACVADAAASNRRQPQQRRPTTTTAPSPSSSSIGADPFRGLRHATTMRFLGPPTLRQPVLGIAGVDDGAAALRGVVRAMAAVPTAEGADRRTGFHTPLKFGWRRGLVQQPPTQDGVLPPRRDSAATTTSPRRRASILPRPRRADLTSSPVEWLDVGARGVFDAVITYVDEAAPGFEQSARRYAGGGLNTDYDLKRFRDLGELRYLIRSLHRFGAGLIRRIVLVVADEGHVPKWINRTSTEIPFAFVTHADLFPDPVNQLPTFNSFSIETVLHRIAGLSDYFLYFNNDMLLGRRLSLLDLFRPVAGGSLADGAVDVETVLYAENKDLPPTCELDKSYVVENSPESGFAARTNAVEGSTLSPFPRLLCTTPIHQPAGVEDKHDRSDFNRLYRYNKRLIWDRLGIVPTHSFAHTFKLFRRPLLEAMVERQYPDVVASTRSYRFRYVLNFWVTFVYGYYELAQRTWTLRDDADVNQAVRSCVVALSSHAPPPGATAEPQVARVWRAGVDRLLRSAWRNIFLSKRCLAATRVVSENPLQHDELQFEAESAEPRNDVGERIYDMWRTVGVFPQIVPLSCRVLTESRPDRRTNEEAKLERANHRHNDRHDASNNGLNDADDSSSKLSASTGGHRHQRVLPCFDWDNDMAQQFWPRDIGGGGALLVDDDVPHGRQAAYEDNGTRYASLQEYLHMKLEPEQKAGGTIVVVDDILTVFMRIMRIPTTTETKTRFLRRAATRFENEPIRAELNDVQRSRHAVVTSGGRWAIPSTMVATMNAGLRQYDRYSSAHNHIEERLFANFFTGYSKSFYYFAMVSNTWQLEEFREQILGKHGSVLSITFNDDFAAVSEDERTMMGRVLEKIVGSRHCAMEMTAATMTTKKEGRMTQR